MHNSNQLFPTSLVLSKPEPTPHLSALLLCVARNPDLCQTGSCFTANKGLAAYAREQTAVLCDMSLMGQVAPGLPESLLHAF